MIAPDFTQLKHRTLKTPLAVSLNITSKCNLKCPHCSASANGKSDLDLNWEEWRKIVEQIIAWKVPLLIISGGEPLLFDGLIDLINMTPKWLHIHVNTNATLMNPEFARLCAERRILVGISIDGGPQLHDQIRGEGAFNGMIRGVKSLLAEHCNVLLRFTALKTNYQAIYEAAASIQSLGIDNLFINRPICTGRLKHNQQWLDLNTKERLEVADICDEVKMAFPDFTVNAGDFYNYRQKYNAYLQYRQSGAADEDICYAPIFVCSVGINSFVINSDGIIVPCNGMSSLHCGSVKTSPMQEIWATSPVFEEFRRLRFLKLDSIAECKNCELCAVCSGGCRANAYNYWGRLDTPDPTVCWKINASGDENGKK
jgi:Fe-coproporphyrin III synthase